jgi:hypothetical protein
MGRARRGESVFVTARVPRSLARDFQRIATREERSVSAELRRLMKAHVSAAKAHG